jgi:hypothetical protein
MYNDNENWFKKKIYIYDLFYILIEIKNCVNYDNKISFVYFKLK